MSKLLSTLLAGAAALAMSGTVIAADQQARDNQTEAQPNATGKPGQSEADRAQSPNDSAMPKRQSRKDGPNDPAQGKPTQNQADQSGTDDSKMSRNEDQTGENMSAKEKAYSADLKKCDSMKSEQKSKCVATAKKKHGPMAQQSPSGSPTADQQTRVDGSNDPAQGAPADSQATQSGSQTDQAGNQTSQSDSNTGNTAADQSGGDVSAQYSADLKKCDALKSEQQQKCVATAKKKHGQM